VELSIKKLNELDHQAVAAGKRFMPDWMKIGPTHKKIYSPSGGQVARTMSPGKRTARPKSGAWQWWCSIGMLIDSNIVGQTIVHANMMTVI